MRPECTCHHEPMHKNGYRLDGTPMWRCGVDQRRKERERYLDPVYREKLLARQKARRADPEVAKQIKEQRAGYRQRPEVKEAARVRERNRDRRCYLREWSQRPDVKARRNEYMARYMREHRAKVGKALRKQLPSLIEDQDGCCNGCGKGIQFGPETHVDHVTPVVSGGTDERENLQALCRTCNLSKGAQEWATWQERMGYE